MSNTNQEQKEEVAKMVAEENSNNAAPAVRPGAVHATKERRSKRPTGSSSVSSAKESDVVATKQSTGERAVVPGAVPAMVERRTKRAPAPSSSSSSSSNNKSKESDVVATKQSTGERAVRPGAVHAVKERRSKGVPASSRASGDVVATKQSTGERAVVPGAVPAVKERRSKGVPAPAKASGDVVATKQSTGERAVVPGAVPAVKERRSKGVPAPAPAPAKASGDVVATKQSTGERAVVPGAVPAVKERRSKGVPAPAPAKASGDVVATKQSTGERAVVPGAVPAVKERRSKGVPAPAPAPALSGEKGDAVATKQSTEEQEVVPGAVPAVKEHRSKGVPKPTPTTSTVGEKVAVYEDEDDVEPEDEEIGRGFVGVDAKPMEYYDQLPPMIPEKEVESTPLTQPIIIASAAAMASPSEPVIYNEYGEVVKPHEYVQDVYKPPDDMGVQVIVDAEDVIVDEYESEEVVKKRFTKKAIAIGLGVVVIAATISVVVALLLLDNSSSSSEAPSAAPSFAPTSNRLSVIIEKVTAAGVSSIESFDDRNGPQFLAAEFIADVDKLDTSDTADELLIQRYIMTTFYYSTGGESWLTCGQIHASCTTDGDAYSYLSENSECDWLGSSCDRDGYITEVSFIYEILEGANAGLSEPLLEGSLPAELGYLSRLKSLIINNDNLEGTIPTEFGLLTSLEILHLTNQRLNGRIPLEFSALTELRELRLSHNYFDVFVNSNFWEGMTNLKRVYLNDNRIPRRLPNELFNHPSIEEISCLVNQFTNTLPEEMSTSLKYLNVGGNSLTGTLPSSIYNLTNIEFLRLDSNELGGTLSSAIGSLTSLTALYLRDNNFTGEFPEEIKNLVDLERLTIDDGFTGNVPEEVCDFGLLTFLIDCPGLQCNGSCCGDCFIGE